MTCGLLKKWKKTYSKQKGVQKHNLKIETLDRLSLSCLWFFIFYFFNKSYRITWCRHIKKTILAINFKWPGSIIPIVITQKQIEVSKWIASISLELENILTTKNGYYLHEGALHLQVWNIVRKAEMVEDKLFLFKHQLDISQLL